MDEIEIVLMVEVKSPADCKFNMLFEFALFIFKMFLNQTML